MKDDMKTIENYFNEAKSNHIQFQGDCHDCGKSVSVNADIDEDGSLVIDGGAVYFTESGVFMKCDDCFKKDLTLKNFQPCEVYSRVVGYLRPIQNYNPGKKSEFENRQDFKLPTKEQLKSLNFE